MPFQIKPASYPDLDALADVLVKAHVNDALFQELFLKVPHEVRVTWYADAFRKTWEEKWMRYYKVVELETRYASLYYSNWSCFSYLREPLCESFYENSFFCIPQHQGNLFALHFRLLVVNQFANRLRKLV